MTIKQARKAGPASYERNWLEIRGVVDGHNVTSLDTAGERKFCFMVEEDPEQIEKYTVPAEMECFMTEASIWKKASIGSKVTIRGRLAKGPHGNRLVDCTLLATTGAGAIEISASDFVQAAAKDLQAAKAKFDEKSVIVRGKFKSLADRSKDEQFSYYYIGMYLEGADGKPCPVHFLPSDIDRFQSCQPGDPITLIGVGAVDVEEGEPFPIGLGDAYRLPE